MSNKLKMDKIEAIRNLAAQGWSQRRIARELDTHRSAVKRALQSVQADDDDSKRARVMTGNPVPTQSMCDPFRVTIESKLERGLDAKRIHRDLQAEYAFEGSYNSVQRFVKSLKESSPKRVWRMEVEPGEEAQIDYGTMTIIEGEDGRLKRAQLLRVNSKLESVRVHARLAPGKFTQVLGADGRRGSFEESCGYYRSRCSRMGPNAAAWADGVLANRGEMAVRIMQGLLSLNGKYSKAQVDAACAKATLHGHYRLGELKNWLVSPQRQESFSFLESHEIIRAPVSYDSHIGGASLFDPGN